MRGLEQVISILMRQSLIVSSERQIGGESELVKSK
jgi:hypothetical protein